MIYEQILSAYKQLEKQISELQSKIKSLPNGKLICSHNGKNYKWYQSDGHSKIYIPKKNRQLAEQLAAKKYLTLLSEYLSDEKKALGYYLKLHRSNTNRAEELLANTPEYQSLLPSHFKPVSQDLSDWMHSTYEHNPKFPEQLIHKSSSGNLVRSKSESIIDMFLYLNQIPFRYECALQLGESTIFPDFTIRHPQTGKIYYWEHFGLMDNPTYCRNACSKIQLYASHGIIPSIQLITTYETQDNPLTMEVVDKIVTHYFL